METNVRDVTWAGLKSTLHIPFLGGGWSLYGYSYQGDDDYFGLYVAGTAGQLREVLDRRPALDEFLGVGVPPGTEDGAAVGLRFELRRGHCFKVTLDWDGAEERMIFVLAPETVEGLRDLGFVVR